MVWTRLLLSGVGHLLSDVDQVVVEWCGKVVEWRGPGCC